MPPDALVNTPISPISPYPQYLGYGCCELPPHCTDLVGERAPQETQESWHAGENDAPLPFLKNKKRPFPVVL